MEWLRLWHDMPTDPKWRGISRRSGRPIHEVLSVYLFVLVNASSNMDERGRTSNISADDLGDALDMEERDVQSILTAMIGKVIDEDGRLSGWEKRQIKRERQDLSTERVRRHRRKGETPRNAMEHHETPRNAEKHPDKIREEESSVSNDTDASVAGLSPTQVLWSSGLAYFKSCGLSDAAARSLLGKWRKDMGGDEAALVAIGAAQRLGIIDPASWGVARARALKESKREWEAPC